MTQRYTCNGVAWRRSVNASCPLCGDALESLQHTLVDCPRSSHLANKKIAELQHLYNDELLPPPSSSSELLSAILNGDRYRRDSPGVDPQLSLSLPQEYTNIIILKTNAIEGHIKATIICDRIHIGRQLIVNQID